MRAIYIKISFVVLCSLLLVGADCEGGPGGGGEICGDNEDNDGDGAIDEGEDLDGDGYFSCDIPVLIDCDDTDADVHPEQTDACDGRDSNCNGVVDDVDADGDEWIDIECGGDDCDDSDPDANPATIESCDFADNNCNGEIDEGFDADDDGWSFCEGDCRDSDVNVNPDAVEECDGLDNDCDNDIDEDFDEDGDGYINRLDPNCSDLYGVGAPLGADGDCDDTNEWHRPGAHEDPTDDTDNDCDGCTDECEDFDRDGYDNCDETDEGDPNCASDNDGGDGLDADCLDVAQNYYTFEPIYSHLTQLVHPGITFNVQCEETTVVWPEQCDKVDNDCDGRIDTGYDPATHNPGKAICGG